MQVMVLRVLMSILHFSILFSDPQFSEAYHYAGRRVRAPTYVSMY